jgi:hypothetical protein
MSTTNDTESAVGLSADRRAFLFGLGVTAAAASFAPFMTARAAVAAPALAAAPVPAVFWGLPYVDFTGTAAPHVPPRRYAAERAPRALDPHAEMFAAG